MAKDCACCEDDGEITAGPWGILHSLKDTVVVSCPLDHWLDRATMPSRHVDLTIWGQPGLERFNKVQFEGLNPLERAQRWQNAIHIPRVHEDMEVLLQQLFPCG